MQRVLLRQWTEADLDPYAELNSDPEVMRHFPRLLTREESADSMARLRAAIDERGWGLWVVEVEGKFAGFTGLNIPRFEAPFIPCTEIGWRLKREYWGRGLAYEAAQQALKYGFEVLELREIVAFTAQGNLRSRQLMERLGFSRDPAEDFDHPLVPEGHEARRHVLYRKQNVS